MQPASYVLRRDDRIAERQAYKISDLTPEELENWFDVKPDDERYQDALERAWLTLAHHIGTAFKGQMLEKTPSATGMKLMQATLPRNPKDAGRWYEYHPMPAEALKTVRQFFPSMRSEIIHKDRPFRNIYTYDGRVMYAALLRELPVLLSPDDFIHDNESAYEGKRHGLYRVDVTVPQGWHHMGLLPIPIDGIGNGWLYPHRPGEQFGTWANQKDLYWLQQHNWQFAIRERMLFHVNPKVAQPLSPFADHMLPMLDMIEAACKQEMTQTRRYIRAGLRNIIIKAIGRLYAAGKYVEVPLSEMDTNKEAETYYKPDGSLGARIWQQNTAYRNRWLKPEWAMTVWRGNHQRTTLKAITHHYEDVIGIYADAIYCATDPKWSDDGKIGSHRLKGERHFNGPQRLKATHNAYELSSLAKGGEK